jgi:Xaa-Pro dipeptidase
MPTLPFEVSEFQHRLARLRERMEQRGLDGLLVTTPENIYYLSGFKTTGFYTYQALLVPLREEPMMIPRGIEATLVGYITWFDRAFPFADTDDPVEVTARAVAECGLAEGRLGVETESILLTVARHRRLAEYLPQATLVDADNLVEDLRIVKSAQEIAYARQAAVAASAGVQAGFAEAAVGKTENDVAAAAIGATYRAGSEYTGSPGYVVAGKRTGLGHATWERHAIERGDPLYLEIGGNIHRYGAAQIRTASVGPASDALRRMSEASIAGLEAAIAAIRPGVTSGQVDAACRGAVERLGQGHLFHHRTGYSIGLGFPPGWSEGHILDLKPNDPRELQANMVFHIVPVLLDPEVCGTGFSETVLVTEDGCEVLTSGPRELIQFG